MYPFMKKLIASVISGIMIICVCIGSGVLASASENMKYDLNRPIDDPTLYIDVEHDLGEFGTMSYEELAAQFETEGKIETDFGTMPYRLYTPKVQPGEKYPVVVILHGSGGRGEDNITSFKDPAILIKRLLYQQEQYPCYIFVPQCPAGGDQPRWEDVNANLIDFLNSFSADAFHQVKSDNLIAMGISMGGYGVWDLATTFPGFFRTVVPIAGGGNIKEVLKLGEAGTRLWAFHQTEDPTCPVAGERTGVPNWTITKRAGQGPYGTRTLVQTLRDAGYPANYYEYNRAGHEWKLASSEKELIDWIFEQSETTASYVMAGNREIYQPAPYYREDRVLMMPLRAICEALGFIVEWDDATQTVCINKDAAFLAIGDTVYRGKDSIPCELSAAPVLFQDSITYVPEEFFTTVLQLDVSLADDGGVFVSPGKTD